MSWGQTIPAFCIAALVIFGPGLLWGAALGLRRLPLLAVAGPLSITAAVVAAESAALAGIRWSLLPVAVISIVVGALLWLIRRRFSSSLHRDTGVNSAPAPWRPVLLAWAVAAIPVAAVMIWIFGVPENIAQSHDNIFHLNALRYIDDTGNASSLTLGYLGTRSGTFYPAAWHAVVSVVIATTGIPIAAAVNVTNLVIITGIWSVGCLFLVTRMTGEKIMPLLVAAVLSTAYSSFPYLLLEFGVVYPFMLSIAMLPAVLGVVIQLLRVGMPTGLTAMGCVLLLIGILPGLALAHPSTLMGALALSTPMVLAVAYRRLREQHGRRRLYTIAGTLAFLLVGAVLWMTLRPARSGSANWDELGNAPMALYEVLLHSPLSRPIAVMVTVLSVVGAVVVLRKHRHRWILGMYLVAALLYVVGNWRQAPDIRWIVAGVWYNDFFRISAMLPVAGILVASVGGIAVASALFSWAEREFASESGSHRRWFTSTTAAVLTIAALAAVPFFAVQQAVSEAAAKNRFTETSQLLTLDELALLERLPEHVPADAVIAGDPLTGASLSYAYTGVESLLPYGTSPPTEEGRLIMESLDEHLGNPAVCVAADAKGVGFVLDFGTSSVHPGETSVQPGLDNLSPRTGFELVDSEGEAELWRVTGC